MLLRSFEVVGPKGDIVHSGYIIPQWEAPCSEAVASSLGFQWTIPSDAIGGEYTVRTTAESNRAPAERTFQASHYYQYL